LWIKLTVDIHNSRTFAGARVQFQHFADPCFKCTTLKQRHTKMVMKALCKRWSRPSADKYWPGIINASFYERAKIMRPHGRLSIGGCSLTSLHRVVHECNQYITTAHPWGFKNRSLNRPKVNYILQWSDRY